MVNGATTLLQERLKEEAARLGFAACGIAPAGDDPQLGARLEQWLLATLARTDPPQTEASALWPIAEAMVLPLALMADNDQPREPRAGHADRRPAG